ncbi:MAG: hypothetical protein HYR63_11995 [Proteobacteria bacterium]|nr:hypothetical protein [Pseudomonadota bacterium]MBI3498516.1 hypothetical protein [Pseudomonadota bacterium]
MELNKSNRDRLISELKQEINDDLVQLKHLDMHAKDMTKKQFAKMKRQLAPQAVGAASIALQHIEAIFAGDLDAISLLLSTLPEQSGGKIAVAMYRAGLPDEALRRGLGSAWDLGHNSVLDACEAHFPDDPRHGFFRMFGSAKFPPPPELPETVQIWRGAAGLTNSIARRHGAWMASGDHKDPKTIAIHGLSWTLDRDIACWFAMRGLDSEKDSVCVLSATVPRQKIVYYSNDRDEQEVIVDRPAGAAVDGTQADWKAGHQRVMLARKRELTAPA